MISVEFTDDEFDTLIDIIKEYETLVANSKYARSADVMERFEHLGDSIATELSIYELNKVDSKYTWPLSKADIAKWLRHTIQVRADNL